MPLLDLGGTSWSQQWGLSSELRVGGRVLDSTEEPVFSPRLKPQLGFPGPGAPAISTCQPFHCLLNLPPHAGKSEKFQISARKYSGFLPLSPSSFLATGHGFPKLG